MKLHHLQFRDNDIAALKNVEYTKDWPVVYLLNNGREVYIGETTTAYHRFKQHAKNPERLRLKDAHIVIDEEYNKSASLDIESRLIQYMAADARFELQNKNGGLANHSYYDRARYGAKFEVLWAELQKRGLAEKDLIQLRNSDVFKYSPYKALTEEQKDIVIHIRDDLSQHNYKTYVVNGEPGTGKSVLATFLAKYLIESEKASDIKLALVIPMTSLRATLKKVFKKIKGLNAGMVIGPGEVVGKDYDLLIVDEAHRLRQRKNLNGYGPFDRANEYYGLGKDGTHLDWILRASKSQVLMFDENQTIGPGDIPTHKISGIKAETFHLTSQLRVLGGNDYIKFIDDLLGLRPIEKNQFENYDLRVFDSADYLIKEIKQRNQEHGLARTVAGYAWDWKTKTGDQDYGIELDGLKLVWNSVNVDWVNSHNAINEIGCIHTIQGYDLNYVGVIIGPELSYDPVEHKLIVDRDKYKDRSGKTSLESPEELERYIINIYKTLLTRGIKGTYIYATEPSLRDYLRSNIDRALR